MRNPFTYISRRFSEVQATLDGIRDAINGLRGSMPSLVDAIEANRPLESAQGAPADDVLEALGAKIADLALAVDEGIKNVQRSERRVRSVVQSARKELAEAGFEHAGVEAEASELREVHGNGSQEGDMQAVPTNVEDDSQIPSGIPGVSLRQARTARHRR